MFGIKFQQLVTQSSWQRPAPQTASNVHKQCPKCILPYILFDLAVLNIFAHLHVRFDDNGQDEVQHKNEHEKEVEEDEQHEFTVDLPIFGGVGCEHNAEFCGNCCIDIFELCPLIPISPNANNCKSKKDKTGHNDGMAQGTRCISQCARHECQSGVERGNLYHAQQVEQHHQVDEKFSSVVAIDSFHQFLHAVEEFDRFLIQRHFIVVPADICPLAHDSGSL
mmetsp:Transcript_33273/g.48598  ORF Transcript_33273/g.48598 Transcript_33273/m.48598 type:complete len:222 (-) Transcript_33273:2314-2979(-)